MTRDARFWSKVDKSGPDGCWLWTASGCGGNYGQFSVGGKNVKPHRYAYERLVGPIPAGLDLDHDCHNRDLACPGGPCRHRRCVNPDHLVPRTRRENSLRGRAQNNGDVNRRKTHCPQGHPYDDENTYTDRLGKRQCVECNRTRARDRARAKRAA